MNNSPLLPEGVPQRPGLETYALQFGLFETLLLGATLVNFANNSAWSWATLALFLTLAICALKIVRRLDRVGWYKQVSVPLPPMPFEHGVKNTAGYTSFSGEHLSHQGGHNGNHREVPYSRIKRIEIIYYKGTPCGVAVVEPGRVPVELQPFESRYDNDMTLVLMYLQILAQFAPQARFVGEAHAMKEGWIRRTLRVRPHPLHYTPIAELPPPPSPER